MGQGFSTTGDNSGVCIEKRAEKAWRLGEVALDAQDERIIEEFRAVRMGQRRGWPVRIVMPHETGRHEILRINMFYWKSMHAHAPNAAPSG